MNKNYYGVIMAGGVGSRFWPLSRKKMPKQFIDIFGKNSSLFREAHARLAKLCPPENIYIVTNELYRNIIKNEIPALKDDQILGEPHPRNTAPCIGYAAFKIASRNPDAIMVVLPSDHIILNEETFHTTMLEAYNFAEKHPYLITLGIEPTRPDTGYGYIQIDEKQKLDNFFRVKTFTEKPNLELAKQLYESGEFLWNSGMFIWQAKTIVDEYHKHLPELYNIFKKGDKYYYTDEEKDYIRKSYEMCTIVSIDYGIMEKAREVYVLPASFNWSDIGTWNALYAFSNKDKENNAVKGDMVLLRNTQNCIVNVPNKMLVVLNSVSNLIVVESDGILLIADKDKEQEIKLVVNDIKQKYGEKYV
jgi:mannose-1-phosphate guanylyltransferase